MYATHQRQRSPQKFAAAGKRSVGDRRRKNNQAPARREERSRTGLKLNSPLRICLNSTKVSGSIAASVQLRNRGKQCGEPGKDDKRNRRDGMTASFPHESTAFTAWSPTGPRKACSRDPRRHEAARMIHETTTEILPGKTLQGSFDWNQEETQCQAIRLAQLAMADILDSA